MGFFLLFMRLKSLTASVAHIDIDSSSSTWYMESGSFNIAEVMLSETTARYVSTISAVPSTVGAELGVAGGAVLGVAVGVVLGVVEGDFVGAFVFGPSMRLPFGLFCNIDMLRDMDIDIDVLRDIDVLVNMLVMKYSKSGGFIIIDIESGISTRDSTIDMDVSVFQTLPKIIFLPPIFLRTTDGPSSSKAPLNELLASAQNLTARDASRRKQRVLIMLLVALL